MTFTFRAAGLAAATLLAVLGTAFAAPARAWDAVPTSFAFLDHETATLQGGDLGLNADEGAIPPAPETLPIAEPAPVPEPVPAPVKAVAIEPEPAPIRLSLAELVAEHGGIETDDSEHECLAGAVYFESKGEPLQGQLSVAEVILNRTRSGRFPSSICGVVKQRSQFSFVRGGRFPPIARTSAAWRKAVGVARVALRDLADGPAPRALFFHATYVSPGWRGLTRVATVGNHIFYR
ncbi:MAG TPA: cell wall hydrolase [Allosphingosinicella sp.]